MRPSFESTPGPYTGPVPMVVHVHGAEARDWADGYAEAWHLSADASAPSTVGTWYDFFKGKAEAYSADCRTRRRSPSRGGRGLKGTRPSSTRTTSARHALVPRPHARHDAAQRVRRAGRLLPAPRRSRRRRRREASARRPRLATTPGTRYYEIPLAIQDRSFNENGSLFYPDNRAFFEGLNLPDEPYLDIPLSARRRATARRATSRRSGSRSSSARRCSSTAPPGPTSTSSSAATASAS